MKLESIFVLLAVLSALIVLVAMHNPVINGAAKAFVGVFIIAYFIAKFFHEPSHS